MAYDKDLAERLRARLAGLPAVAEREMFGGIAFLVGGNMAVGVTGDELMVRVGKDAHDATVSLPGARIFDLSSSRPMIGWLVVAPEGFATEAEFDSWVQRGVDFAESLPPK
ncbi:MAG TPA: TfoX/Sxy family protein [Candidatus Limnocylindria bacterium]|nr:TfoX/Sxy family protein [Candidatus Limnocylindria bacterium]